MSEPQKLWAADPHQFGPGKIHLIDDEDLARTYCGKIMAAFPGKPVTSGKPSCKICVDAKPKRIQARAQQRAWDEKYRREAEERQRVQEEQNKEWWATYNAYLKTPAWEKRRRLVFSRARGICEGCGEREATQVHHLSYEHVTRELLWELRAVCNGCHERIHEQRRGS